MLESSIVVWVRVTQSETQRDKQPCKNGLRPFIREYIFFKRLGSFIIIYVSFVLHAQVHFISCCLHVVLLCVSISTLTKEPNFQSSI